MDLDLLAAKMADEVATSELAMEDEMGSPEGSIHSFIDKQHVQDYIEEQRKFSCMEAPPHNPQFVNTPHTYAPRRIRGPLVDNPAQPVVDNPSSRELFPENVSANPQPYYPPSRGISHSRLSDSFVPLPPSLLQRRNDLESQRAVGTDQCSDFAKFLLKKDLVFSRLSKFDDKPENYLAWKHSFQSVINELDISPSEELDLLVKYLGPNSTNQAISIRSSNPHSHVRGLQRLWSRLEERYGSPEVIEAALKRKLDHFPRITMKEKEKLYLLSDILTEIESAMEDEKLCDLLSYFNTSSGVIPIISKLPPIIQGKWTTTASKYKKRQSVAFPPFKEFSDFIREQCTIMNDPGFAYVQQPPDKSKEPQLGNTYNRPGVNRVNSRKTEVKDSENSSASKCPLHNADHTLKDCRGFKRLSSSEKKKILREWNICFKCCASADHRAKDCDADISKTPKETTFLQGGEPQQSLCTDVCGPGFSGKSCGKAVLVRVYPVTAPENSHFVYALLDDQSNRTLARSQLFDIMCVPDQQSVQYTLSTCAGRSTVVGRQMCGMVVESFDKSFKIELPQIIECNNIPNDRQEIPTPDVVEHFEHLDGVTIPPLNKKANILLLIGRDVPDVHHVLEQRIGPKTAPFAQRLPLGWVVIGNVCLGDLQTPSTFASVNKTTVLSSGRPTVFEPCERHLAIRIQYPYEDHIVQDVFARTADDEKEGYSVEDREFMQIMDKEFQKTPDGHWVAPLPFRTGRPSLPNNRNDALKRARILQNTLLRDPMKQDHFRTFMTQLLQNGHAEIAPALSNNEECWYLPLFGVYHPRKKDKVRVVFDSSAKHKGLSLNGVLMSGPVLMNSLVGVLLHFCKEPIAVMTDIRQMFYGFFVAEKHRNFLRFLWHRDHDPRNELVEYRMCVHVFGNSPSPAVATYGLRRCVEHSDKPEVQEFVNDYFYVDDGIASFPTEEEAVAVLKKTQETLFREGKLKLHKIASNSATVMKSFHPEDLAGDLNTQDIGNEGFPLQHSLGVVWDINSDSFSFVVRDDQKPFTRRGVLSIVNGLFDPLGIIAPVVLQGKILMRDLIAETTDWDLPLPEIHEQNWREWKTSLKSLEDVQVPRCFLQCSYKECVEKQLHIFSDASEQAIAAVAFLQGIDCEGKIHVGFIFGKSKIAPKHGHTIPRLELCAAVLGVEVGEMVSEYLRLPLDSIIYHTDSRVVLGYLQNTSRRCYIYVSNRVARIHKSSQPNQWNYIRSEENPADCGTRIMMAHQLQKSLWLNGPSFLYADHNRDSERNFPLVQPENDTELRPEVNTCKTDVKNEGLATQLGSSRFKRFSSWKSLLCAVRVLLRFLSRFKERPTETEKGCEIELLTKAEMLVIRAVQIDKYQKEIECLENGVRIPHTSSILKLSPFLDDDKVLRVGGRIKAADMPIGEKHPILIPGKHHIASLIVRHFHEMVEHQGRHITEGAIRNAGYWITGGKRLVSYTLFHCVTCRRLRGKFTEQKMADLPKDRLTQCPPFTYVGVDVFGPWNVVTRRTRGGSANSKRWAVIFTCLYCRAVHIELIEEMTTSSFINSLRRFYAIRGEVKEFRSDRGTNFVGATDTLQMEAINVEDATVKSLLQSHRTVWRFNPPHASHMGGVWERLIGIARRILDNMLLNPCNQMLIHEVLSTLMAEVSAIINARPIVPVSCDAESPFILSPMILLTQKTGQTAPTPELNLKEMYKSQWKCVQILADTFWKRWKSDYLTTLQSRQKWKSQTDNLKVGDVILLRDRDVPRNHWPLGVVLRVFPSNDELVRKIELKVVRDGVSTVYIRPVSETVKLVSV